MPEPLEPWEILDDQVPVSLVLWHHLNDVSAWLHADREPGTFEVPALEAWRFTYPGELRQTLLSLERVWLEPQRVPEGEVASACAEIWEWAERHELLPLALHFAELAARVEPESAPRASTAGRLCRRNRLLQRGTMWFRRASRIARLRNNDAEFSLARLGWSNLEQDLGNLIEAQKHAIKAFRAALRVGRRTDAAYAFHALGTVLIHQDRLDEAWVHLRSAIPSYPADHPRLPALAHDVAYLWSRLGYCSTALPVFERVLPTISTISERLIVLANIAKAAAVAGDRTRYSLAIREVMRLFDKVEIPAAALYHAAHAARIAEEWERAHMLAHAIPETAAPRYRTMQAELLDALSGCCVPDDDILPDDPIIPATQAILLSKLQKHTAPGASGAVPPEKYPIA